MRQEVTRAHKGWALDSVTLHNDVTKMTKEDVQTAPAEGKSEQCPALSQYICAKDLPINLTSE